jgi:hypothetical protein
MPTCPGVACPVRAPARSFCLPDPTPPPVLPPSSLLGAAGSLESRRAASLFCTSVILDAAERIVAAQSPHLEYTRELVHQRWENMTASTRRVRMAAALSRAGMDTMLESEAFHVPASAALAKQVCPNPLA